MSPAASSSLTGLYGGGGSHTGGGNLSPAATTTTGNSSLLAKLNPAVGGGPNTPHGGMGSLCQTIEASELNLQRIVGTGAYGKVGEIPL